MKIKTEDKALIRAYAKWAEKKGFFPTEFECSKLIENMNCDHRDLVEDFLSEIAIKQYNNAT